MRDLEFSNQPPVLRRTATRPICRHCQ